MSSSRRAGVIGCGASILDIGGATTSKYLG
jgi:hypothetical protein